MKTHEFEKIGTELVAASKDAERTPGEVLQELFPYIYEASRRMSARQISAWLQENTGIQVSQPTISRALRNPKAFWTGFAESIEPVARRVATSLRTSMKELLVGGDDNESNYYAAVDKDEARKLLSKDELKEVEEGMEFLREKWFCLSAGTRRACVPSFVQFEESEDDHGDTE